MDANSLADLVVNAVTGHSMGTARTAQSLDNRIGASEVGMCRSYLQRVIQQEERREEERVPWAAFIGTAVGEFLERALLAEDENVVLQQEVLATLPSGRTVPGHVDAYLPMQYADTWSPKSGDQRMLLDPGYVLDFKAKDGLYLASKEEADRSHLYQIVLYWLALVQAGLIGPDGKAFIVYVDRSGKQPRHHAKEIEDPQQYVTEIDEWLDDAIYAVLNQTEASRDRPYQWCEVACPFFWACRGSDEFHAEGLIDDPEKLAAVTLYQEGLAQEKEGKAKKEEGRDALIGVSGSTGDVVVSWTKVNPSQYEVIREGYERLNLRRLNPKSPK